MDNFPHPEQQPFVGIPEYEPITVSNEQLGRYGIDPLELDYLEDVLNCRLRVDDDVDPNSYDERREIYRQTIAIREDMRMAMLHWAQAQGIEVGTATVRDWQPGLTEMEAIKYQAQELQRRLRMIYGIEDFSIDQAEMAFARGVPLRDYQLDAAQGFYNFLVHAPRNPRGGKRGIVEMPTGTGKTGPLIDAVAKLKYGETDDDPVRIIILTPKLDIGEQIIRKEIPKFAPYLMPKIGVVNQFSKDLNAEIMIMTNASFCNLAREDNLPPNCKLVVDEVHMLLGEQISEYIEAYVSRHDTELIGFTATTAYNEERSVYTSLFDHEIYRMEFKDAVHSARLAPVRGYVHNVEPQLHLIKLSNDPAVRKQSIRKAHLAARMQHAVGIIKRAVKEGKGVIVRCPPGDDIDIAVQFAAYLRDMYVGNVEYGLAGSMPICAEAVGGSSKRENWAERQQKYEDFSRGSIDVLVHVKAIDMGVNLPRAKIAINIESTTSAVKKRQGDGRVMRLMVDQQGLPVEAEVHDYYDPDLGDKQYTCLDAFETKHGELLGHTQSYQEAPIPIAQRFRKGILPIMGDVHSTILQEGAVLHHADASLPSHVEITSVLDAIHGDTISLPDASAILGIHVPTLRNIVLGLGSNPDHDITKEEVAIILELYPNLNAETLPPTGYVHAREVCRRAPIFMRLLTLLPVARREGIHPQRLIDPNTAQTGFYFTDEQAARLLRIIEDRSLRQRRP